MAKEPDGHRVMQDCKYCESEFRTFPSYVKKGRGLFCSQKCGREYRSEQARIRNTRTCLRCEKDFVAAIQNIGRGNGKYCSRLCQNRAIAERNKGKPKNWTKEWKEKLRLASEARRGKPSPKRGMKYPHLTGEKHWNWKGGKSSESEKQRVAFKRTTQKDVLKRDNYTCQNCRKTGAESYLHVDHIKSWKDYPALRLDPDNCQTLCMGCHYEKTYKRKLPQGVSWGIMPRRRMSNLV